MDAAAVLVDGIARDSVAVTDRGLAFGDGIFRTFAVRHGRPLNWAWHWKRLVADCATLALAPPEPPVLLEEIGRVAPGDAVVKMIVTRGDAPRGFRIPARSSQTRVVMAFAPAAYPPSHSQDGVAVRRCRLVLSEQPRLAGAKTLNRLENVLARAEWQDASIAEGLLCDAGGNVIEGTMTNVFAVHGRKVVTPALGRCGVIGAQRERVREILGRERIACAEAELPWERLLAADEVFLTNSLIGVWPVVALGDRRWPVGPMARLARERIEADDAHA